MEVKVLLRLLVKLKNFLRRECMILIKDNSEIEKMRAGGKILAKILITLIDKVKPGVNTLTLEEEARGLIKKYHTQPAFLNYKGYPAVLCVSINEEIVHGIPSREKLIHSGDLVSLDLGILYQGMITDMAITVGVGKLAPQQQLLLETTRKALKEAVKKAKVGNKVIDISAAIQRTIEKAGFTPIRDCVGHGVGKLVHEDPLIPNVVEGRFSENLVEGMTLALEPIATLGDYPTVIGANGWTVLSRDKKVTAHFEQTVVVGKSKGEILTPLLVK
jgi:methionyl aminopeptidase